jgi:hypothetical protein
MRQQKAILRYLAASIGLALTMRLCASASAATNGKSGASYAALADIAASATLIDAWRDYYLPVSDRIFRGPTTLTTDPPAIAVRARPLPVAAVVAFQRQPDRIDSVARRRVFGACIRYAATLQPAEKTCCRTTRRVFNA